MSSLISNSLLYLGLIVATRIWTAAGVTLIFAVLGRLVHGVTLSGASAGAVVAFCLYAGAGPGAFVALVCVFAITWLATRLGYRRKLDLGTAEKRDGRTASQVLANLAVAAGLAVVYSQFVRKEALLVAIAAVLSEAAADTVSSELGQAFGDRVRLITDWQEVTAGIDGGVSLTGTLAGIVAAIVVSSICFVVSLIPGRWMAISAIAGTAGMIADSYMGALLERRRILNNDSVNFLSTLIAAAAALLLTGRFN